MKKSVRYLLDLSPFFTLVHHLLYIDFHPLPSATDAGSSHSPSQTPSTHTLRNTTTILVKFSAIRWMFTGAVLITTVELISLRGLVIPRVDTAAAAAAAAAALWYVRYVVNNSRH